jgi:hypothetical protein
MARTFFRQATLPYASIHLHLLTCMSVSGGSQIDKPLPSSGTYPRYDHSLPPRMASTSSAEAMIKRSQIGQYPAMLILRQVSILDSCTAIRASFLQVLAVTYSQDLHKGCSNSPQCMHRWGPGHCSRVTHPGDPNRPQQLYFICPSFIRYEPKYAWDIALDDAIKVS